MSTNITITGDMYIVDGLYFKNFKRMISHLGIEDDLMDSMRQHRALYSLARHYKSYPEPAYDNFAWQGAKGEYFTRQNVYRDGDAYVANVDFRIRMPWGMIDIKKTNRIQPAYTMEGFDTGIILVRSRSDAEVFCPDKSMLRFINHDTNAMKASILSSYITKRASSEVKNIVISDMFPSLLNACKAGLVSEISCAKSKERAFAKVLLLDRDAMAVSHLRINGVTPVLFIAQYISVLTNKEVRIGVQNGIFACRETGEAIPDIFASLLAINAEMPSPVAPEIKAFIFKTVDAFYSISYGYRTSVTEKFGGTVHVYTGKSDNKTARKVASAITSLPVIKDELKDIKIKDVVSLVHEYLGAKRKTNASDNSSIEFGGVDMVMDFTNGALVFNDIGNKSVSARWLSSPNLGRKPTGHASRAMTFKYIFSSTEDAQRALRGTYLMSLSVLFDVPCRIAVSANTTKAARNVVRYFSSTAFNTFSSSFKHPDIMSFSGREVAVIMEREEADFGGLTHKIVILRDEEDAEIDFYTGALSPAKSTSLYNLQVTNPDKWYIYYLGKMLKELAEEYSDMEQLKAHMSIGDNLKRFVDAAEVDSIY